MPGILYHLTFAKEVYTLLNNVLATDKISFMSGNLIPDLATDKKMSHYRTKASIEIFDIPCMTSVKKDLFIPQNPVKLGMYCHLYLDYYFIEQFLLKQFVFDVRNDSIFNPRNGKHWRTDEFFSDDAMYGSYTEINGLLLRDRHVTNELINQIPEVLPKVGMPKFDTRYEKTWKKELSEYTAQKKEYTGDVFDYDSLTYFISKIAEKFVEDFQKELILA